MWFFIGGNVSDALITEEARNAVHLVVIAQSATLPSEAKPPMSPLLPAESQRIILRGILFDFGKTDLKYEAKPVLNAAARILREHPSMRVIIEGHTDALGTDDYNQQLSEQRALAVKQYLVSKGIEAERLQAVGKGRSEPLVPSITSEGKDNPDARAINRRAELKLHQ